jgi:type IV pilus assembly protein PilM
MFGFSKNSFLGIDIGTSSIKIVEVKMSGGKPILSNYAWMNLSGPEMDNKMASFDTVMLEHLKRMLKEGDFKSKKAFVSLPSFGGLVTLIEFPAMDEKDFEQAIRFEAHKYIPTSMDDIVLSWDIVGKKSANKSLLRKADEVETAGGQKEAEEKIQVLLVAAPKSRVAKYEQLVKKSGLDVGSIEIESFAIARSLVGNDQGNFIVVDIGSRVCNIILIEKGIVKVNRNIDAGGRDITRAIARSMSVDEERAEKLKVSGKEFLNRESGITFPVLDMVGKEVERVLGAYYKNEAGKKIDAVILSGGTAALGGLEKYFSDLLKARVITGDPLSRVEYDAKLKPALSQIKGQLSVSIGLALKGAEEYLRN